MIHTITLRNGDKVSVADAATAAMLAIAGAKQACADAILASHPEYRQRNAALGLYDEAEVAAMRAHILACKAVEDSYTMSVEAILAGVGTDEDKITDIAAL